MSNDTDQRIERLRATKLAALVRGQSGRDETEGLAGVAGIADGAALVDGETAWVYLAHRPPRRVGAALAWALRRGAARLAVVVDDPDDAGVVLRRASGFAIEVAVFVAVGRDLIRHDVAAPLASAPALPERHLDVRPLIIEGGAEPVVEHGVLVGEVRGLEVCRVVDDSVTGDARLEVGVGVHDREAFQMVHVDVPVVESLARTVEAVAQQRVVGAPHHPLNRLAPERFLRWRLMTSPDLVGAAELVAADPPVPRESLLEIASCVAHGHDLDGVPLVAVCGVGTDLELVPDALDARRSAGIEPGGRVVVATAGGRLRAVDDLAGLANQPFELASI